MKSTVLPLAVALAAMCSVWAAEPVSKVDAARLQTKLDRISKMTATSPGVATTTSISEVELNSYLRLELGGQIPPGVQDPWVSLLDNGRVTGTATVDLARVSASRKSGGMLDPFNYMTGSLPLTVNGLLRTQNGIGTFTLESASVSGVPVPAWMVQEIVSFYSKSPTTPQGVPMDKPFALPSGIREIQLAKGQATVVQ